MWPLEGGERLQEIETRNHCNPLSLHRANRARRADRAQASASPGIARRVPVQGRIGRRAVRGKGETASVARAELLRRRSARDGEDPRSRPPDCRRRNDRAPHGSTCVGARGESHQGVQAALQHRAAGRQVLSVHQGHDQRTVSARLRHPAADRRRGPLLRAVHRCRRDATGAQRREAHLHGSLVPLRHAEGDAGARVSRLPHWPVQGALHPAPDAGRVSGDDRRGAAVSRWSRGGGDEACARANG